MTYLIIDTNICLHFNSLDEYPWHYHKECDNDITIVITHVLIEELDKKKYGGKDHLKHRAIKTLKLIEQSGNTLLKNGCSLYLFNENVNRDYVESLGLDVLNSDDKMLAIINKFKEISNFENIYLVTNDLGPRLKAKKFNLDSIIPFDKYQLKSPEDELEKSIKLLKIENEKLKNLIPKLCITFDNGDITVKYNITKQILDKNDFINSELPKIKKKYEFYKSKEELQREREQEKSQNIVLSNNFFDSRLNNLKLLEYSTFFTNNAISEEDKEKYNSELLSFFHNYESYLFELYESIIRKKLTIEVSLKLLNEGTATAEDIDIYFHFPDGFELFDERNYPDDPSPPNQPIKPKSLYDFSMPEIPNFNLYSNMVDFSKITSNVSSPTIKKTNSYDVDIHVTKLKHNKSVLLDKMFLIFDSYENMKNFNIDYELRCSNVPNIVKGKLNILFENKGSI